MAIYHLTARGVSPARGSSAVKTSAYISGHALTDERTGEPCRYARAERVAACGLAMPEGVPAWDRQRLWNEAMAAHGGGTELVGKTYEFALPRELDADVRLACVADFCADFTSRRLACDWAVHDSGDGNPHAHVLVSALPIGPDGFERPVARKSTKVYMCRDASGRDLAVYAHEWKAAKAGGLEKVYNFKDGKRRTMSEARAEGLGTADRKSKSPVAVTASRDGTPAFDAERAELVRIRAMWAGIANKRLAESAAAAGTRPASIDHRSNEERGLDEIPHIHVGRSASPERRARNRAIDSANRAIAEAKGRIARIADAARAWWSRKTDALTRRREGFVARHRAMAMSTAGERAERARRARDRDRAPDRPKPIQEMSMADVRAAIEASRARKAADPYGEAKRVAAELSGGGRRKPGAGRRSRPPGAPGAI